MRYGYQDMPDSYTDVDPDKEEPMTTSPICLNCGSPQDFERNICNDCSPAASLPEPPYPMSLTEQQLWYELQGDNIWPEPPIVSPKELA